MELAGDRFCWPHMLKDVEFYISHKCRSGKQNVPTFKITAPLQSKTTTAPFQMLSSDFVRHEKSSGGHECILPMMDHFPRYAQVYATRKMLAKTMAEKLRNDFIMRSGSTKILHHD